MDLVSGMVHTRVKVHRIDSAMSGLVEQPWLQLICYTICAMWLQLQMIERSPRWG